MVQELKTLKRDQWVQETRPPGSGWHGLLVELEASMAGSVDAGAAEDDELCQVNRRQNPKVRKYDICLQNEKVEN